MKIGTIAAAIAASLVFMYVGTQLHIGTPVQVQNASAQTQVVTPQDTSGFVETIKWLVVAGFCGGVAAKVKSLF